MILFYISVVMILLCNIVKGKKSLHMLQQNLYNENNRYLKWIFRNKSQVFTFDLIVIFLTAIGAFVVFDLTHLSTILLFLCFTIYGVISLLLFHRLEAEKTKKPLVITARIKRLIITLSILYLSPVLLLFFSNDQLQLRWISLFILSVMTSFHYFIVYIAKVLNYPVERMVYHYYEHKAKSKLKSMTNLKVIGITGSYGKTSSKNILSDILNIKYIARPTPKNLNTEYGLMITINNHLDKFDEIFIAEMGAYKRGEIKALCDMVHPRYGILTRIGTAHLESFGSEENIQAGKFELIESLPMDGIGVLNRDDPKQVSYPLKNQCKILWIGIENKDVDVYASNIRCSSKGTTFDVQFKGDKKKYTFETRLLGNHNVYNILAALALGNAFHISMKDLQQAVKMVKPIEHRLELKRIGNFYQIDDAYNSNPVGAKSALDVLSMMPGLKVVVTPGMVELGEKEEELNGIFGEQIADVADYVVLIGKQKTKPIYDGLKKKNYDMDKVIIFNDVRDAYPFVQGLKGKEEVYALFENDLPDTYNE